MIRPRRTRSATCAACWRPAGPGRPGALAALGQVARSLGRGTAGLVNALDPHVVTVGGLGRDLLNVAGEAAGQAYLAGLMSFRTPAPPVVPARLGDEAPLVGAAEEAFSLALSEEGLKNWMTHNPGEG